MHDSTPRRSIITCRSLQAAAPDPVGAEDLVRQLSFRPEALPGSLSKHPRRRRYLVVPEVIGLRLVGVSERKKQTLHAAGLLLGARAGRLRSAMVSAWSKGQLQPASTWLD